MQACAKQTSKKCYAGLDASNKWDRHAEAVPLLSPLRNVPASEVRVSLAALNSKRQCAHECGTLTANPPSRCFSA